MATVTETPAPSGFTGQHRSTGARMTGDRRLIVTFGPFGRILRCFEEPPVFRAWPWHRSIDLRPKEWTLSEREPAVQGACQMTYSLSITYQPTIRYAMNNVEKVLGGAHAHIESCYGASLKSIVRGELNTANEDMVLGDLTPLTSRICGSVTEELTKNELQVGAVTCELRFDPESLAHIDRARTLPIDQVGRTDAMPAAWPLYLRIAAAQVGYELDMRSQQLRKQQLGEQAEVDHKREMVDKDSNMKDQLQRERQRKAAFEEHNLGCDERELVARSKLAIKTKTEELRVQHEQEAYEIAQFDKHLEFLRLAARAVAAELEKTNAETDVELALARRDKQREEMRIELDGRKLLADSAVEMSKRRELLKALPEILERVARGLPAVKDVRILQVPGSGASSDGAGVRDQWAGLGGAAVTASSLIHLRELLKFVDTFDRQASTGGDGSDRSATAR